MNIAPRFSSLGIGGEAAKYPHPTAFSLGIYPDGKTDVSYAGEVLGEHPKVTEIEAAAKHLLSLLQTFLTTPGQLDTTRMSSQQFVEGGRELGDTQTIRSVKEAFEKDRPVIEKQFSSGKPIRLNVMI